MQANASPTVHTKARVPVPSSGTSPPVSGSTLRPNRFDCVVYTATMSAWMSSRPAHQRLSSALGSAERYAKVSFTLAGATASVRA